MRQDQQVLMITVRISSLDDECDRVIKPLRIKLEIDVADRRDCPQRSGRLALASGSATKSERGPRRRSGIRRSGWSDVRFFGLAHPDKILLPGLRWRSCRMRFAWGAAPARRKGSLTLVRDGLPNFRAPDQVRGLCRRVIPLRPGALAPCTPGLADGQGCSAALRFNPAT